MISILLIILYRGDFHIKSLREWKVTGDLKKKKSACFDCYSLYIKALWDSYKVPMGLTLGYWPTSHWGAFSPSWFHM